MLWVDAPHAHVKLTLSPDLAARRWCSTLPEAESSAAIVNSEVQGGGLLRKAAFEEAASCSRAIHVDSHEADLPSARFELRHKLPAVLLETQEKISVNVESWIQSLRRKKSAEG